MSTAAFARLRDLGKLSDYDVGRVFRLCVIEEMRTGKLNHLSQKALDYCLPYTKRIARRAEYSSHNYGRRMEPVVHILRQIQLVERNPFVLDCGCGLGSESILFGLMGARVFGADILAEKIECAQERLKLCQPELPENVSIRFESRNVLNIPEIADGTVDMIFVTEAISHIYPPENLLQRARAWLKPHGFLCIADTNGSNPYIKVINMRHFWRERRTLRFYVEQKVDPSTGESVPVAMENVFSPGTMKRLVEKEGFHVRILRGAGYLPPFLGRHPAILRAWKKVESAADRLPIFPHLGTIYTVVAEKS